MPSSTFNLLCKLSILGTQIKWSQTLALTTGLLSLGVGGGVGWGGVVIGHGDKDRYSMTLWEREGRGHSASSNNENLSCVRLSHVSPTLQNTGIVFASCKRSADKLLTSGLCTACFKLLEQV